MDNVVDLGVRSAKRGVIFDEAGMGLPGSPPEPAPLGGSATPLDPFYYAAVRTLGYVHVRPVGGGLMVEFNPRVARRLAVIAAFYELADRAPEKIVLACRDGSDHYEFFCSRGSACRRIKGLIESNA